jgi:hypothetical protein
MDGGLTAGLDYIKGEACVLMTADLQENCLHKQLQK